MQKYIREEQEEKKLLSSYQKELEEKKDYWEKKRDIREGKELISDLGDVEMPVSMIKTLCACFHTFGGRYSVRGEKETIQGLYGVWKVHPELTAYAIDTLAFIYIQDLFEEYSLKSILTEFLKKYGRTDEAFEKYYDFVEQIGKEWHKKFEEEAEALTKDQSLTGEYRKEYLEFLKDEIRGKHIPIEKIRESMPSAVIVQKDEEELHTLSKRASDSFLVGYPISYLMTISLAKGEDLSIYGERPRYRKAWGSTEEIYEAKFTTKEFLESTKKGKKPFEKK